MKRGFTIIELVVVIVLLSLIGLFTFPSISKTIKGRKETLYNVQVDNIKTSAENYINKNKLLSDNDKVVITLCQLKQEGFEDEALKNPITGNYFPDDSKVYVTKKEDGNEYVFEYGTENMIACTKDYKITIEYIEVGSTYIEKEDSSFEITIYKGNEIVDSVDTSDVVTYFIEYKSDEKSYGKYLYVIDTTFPSIVYKEPHKYIVDNEEKEGTEIGEGIIRVSASLSNVFSPYDVIVSDNGEVNLSVNSNVNSKIPGTYYIEYVATDKSKNITRKTQTIIVEDKIGPVIDSVDGLIDDDMKINGNIVISVNAHDNETGLHPRGSYSFDDGRTWQVDNSITIDENKTIKIVVRDAVLNESRKEITINNILKDDKTLSFEVTKGNLKNNGWFVDEVNVEVKPLVSSEYFKSYTYWATSNINEVTEKNEVVNLSNSLVVLNETNTNKYICGYVDKKDGTRTDTICSMNIRIDKDVPTCNVVVESASVNGISGYMEINDTGGSGALESKKKFSNLTGTKNYDIYDKAGNKGVCKVNVASSKYVYVCKTYNSCQHEDCGWDPCLTGENTCEAGYKYDECATKKYYWRWSGTAICSVSGSNKGRKVTASGNGFSTRDRANGACESYRFCTTGRQYNYSCKVSRYYDCYAGSVYDACANGGHNTCSSGNKTCATKVCGCKEWDEGTLNGTCPAGALCKTEGGYTVG